MPTDYEGCREKLQELAEWYSTRSGSRNEATTRLHLVDRLFFECLGWSRDDAVAEEPHGKEYTDYTFSTTRRILIVEAKKEGKYFELPAGRRRPQRKIRGLMQDHPELREALHQVMQYCQRRGVPFAAVTNGHQLVAVIAARNDGVPPADGYALVFPSFEVMLSTFKDLWDGLGKPGMEETKLGSMLAGIRTPELPPRLAETISPYPGVKNRNVFQADMKIVAENVLEDLTRSAEIELPFLKDCYCQSGALSQHSLISKRILEARYAALFDCSTSAVTPVPAAQSSAISAEVLAKSYSRRPILLIGDVGVGKTMFTRNLIKVDAVDLFAKAITLYLDLGSQATMAKELQAFVLNELKRQLREHYDVDTESDSLIRGIYNLDLLRFKKGLYGGLRDTDPEQYCVKEIEFLETLVSDPVEHLRRCLAHLQNARGKQIVIFIDNVDQRGHELQEQAFLLAQEWAEHWPVVVFLALRPATFNQSTKSGVLAGYHPKAFTIAPPRIDRVIRQRLQFAKKLTSGEIPLEALGGRAVAGYAKLDSMLDVCLQSLDCNRELVEFLDNVSNGNVRLALDMVRGFLGSGHVDTEKIVSTFDRTGSYTIPLHEFVRAAIFVDAEHYDPQQSVFTNLFEIRTLDEKEHFLTPLIIGELLGGARDSAHGFLPAPDLYDSMQRLGYLPDQVDDAARRGRERKLIESAGAYDSEGMEPSAVAYRATTLGAYHVYRLAAVFQYVDAMAVVTPVLDANTRSTISDVDGISRRLERCEAFRSYLDRCWGSLRGGGGRFDWEAKSSELEQEMEEIRKRVAD